MSSNLPQPVSANLPPFLKALLERQNALRLPKPTAQETMASLVFLSTFKPPQSNMNPQMSEIFYSTHARNLMVFSREAVKRTIDFYVNDDDRDDFYRRKFPLPEELRQKSIEFEIAVQNETLNNQQENAA